MKSLQPVLTPGGVTSLLGELLSCLDTQPSHFLGSLNKAHPSFLDLFPKSVVSTHLVRIRKGAL